ncbi:MAG: hypothetical protein KGL39_27245 [Patescibacteria group bacterium]|nr:hypothetical protein [Patescibacteria group bacterium]
MPHPIHPKGRGVKSVAIHVVKAHEQRYPTTGDWVYDPRSQHINIFVTETGDWREEQAVAFHEYCEALLCVQHGVDPDSVDEFDQHFEETRDLRDDDGEPGDDLKAPYYLEHQVATSVEHILATHLGLHWNTYDEHCGSASDAWKESSAS